MTLTLPALAKINLDLRVLGVRPDGYHDLRTIFQSVALADRITIEDRPGAFALTCSDPLVPTDRRNLVWKAASLLWRTARLGRGEPRNIAVHLEKRIPTEAGLGGGSSDAAMTLRALNRIWNLGLDPSSLAGIGARLGADVPFFMVGGTALGLGRGDDIYPLTDLPRVHIVIVRPAFGVPTADAYQWFDQERRSARSAAPDRARPAGWPAWAASLSNDLEAPVVRHHPTIGRIRQALLDAGALIASMSGSGSAVFGMFERAEAARRTARDLARPGWVVLSTRSVNRREFERQTRLDPSRSRRVASAGQTRIR